MNRQTNHLQPLALPRTEVVGENAFAGDLLFRKKLAERLTGYVDRLRVGAVLAIDAPWGEGKTWFGRNWAKHLEAQSHKIIFIDAFAQDYVEDPFLLIAAEIAVVLDDGKGASKKLRERAADVMKAILPVGTKALINLAGRVALGSANLSEDVQEASKAAYEGAADSTDKWIEKKLEDQALEKVSLVHFRNELIKFAADQDKPVVIFIDELDRCRPTFAVQLVERIKHFFDVPNLVFVLLINKKQLENAIKGVYGPETEATTYLSKFVHLFLHLPKNISRDVNSYGHPTPVFIKDVLNRYDFNASQALLVKDFTDDFSQWVVSTNMSLRDIERACALFVMSNVANTGFIAYIITLKIKYPTLYEELLRNEPSAHEKAISLLEPLIHKKNPAEMNWPDNYFKSIQELHKLQLGGDLTKDAPCFKEYGGRLFGWRGFSKEATFSDAFNLIDLPVENY
ncbi:MAG: P-loop NTPase fold protein [Gallionellaceae bacterium]|jgi:hypothetical protein